MLSTISKTGLISSIISTTSSTWSRIPPSLSSNKLPESSPTSLKVDVASVNLSAELDNSPTISSTNFCAIASNASLEVASRVFCTVSSLLFFCSASVEKSLVNDSTWFRKFSAKASNCSMTDAFRSLKLPLFQFHLNLIQ